MTNLNLFSWPKSLFKSVLEHAIGCEKIREYKRMTNVDIDAFNSIFLSDI